MKKYFAAYLFFITSFVFADDIFLYPLTMETEQDFYEVSAILVSHNVVKGKFELRRTLKGLTSSGNFIIAGGLGMAWQTLKPYPSTLVAGKDFLIQINAKGKKTKMSADKAGHSFLKISEAVGMIFSGDSNKMTAVFNVYFTKNGRDWELGLIPKDVSMQTFIDRIVVKGDKVIKYVKMESKDGGAMEYILSDHTFENELTDNEKLLFN
jgi:outer membrane lipoprotein-sorting protein